MSILSNQAFAAVLGKGGRRFTRPSEGDGVSNLLLAFRRHVSLPPPHRDTRNPPGKIRKRLQEVPLFDADGAGFGFLVKNSDPASSATLWSEGVDVTHKALTTLCLRIQRQGVRIPCGILFQRDLGHELCIIAQAQGFGLNNESW